MSTLIAGVRSIAAYVAVSLYVAIAAPIGMALALIVPLEESAVRAGPLGRRHRRRRSPASARAWRGESICQPGEAVVFCCNHQSNIDPPILFQALHPRLHVLFKHELTKLPLLGKAFQIGGFVPIDRGSREQSMAAIEQAAESLRQGNSFLTFPEGTRSRTGALLPFKRGPFLMALKAQVPVVPVAIQGGDGVDAEGQPDRPADHRQRADWSARRDARNGRLGSRDACGPGALARRRAARARAGHANSHQASSRPQHFDRLLQPCLLRVVALGGVNPRQIQASVRRREAFEKLPRARVLLDGLLDVRRAPCLRCAISTTGRPSGLRASPGAASFFAAFSSL